MYVQAIRAAGPHVLQSRYRSSISLRTVLCCRPSDQLRIWLATYLAIASVATNRATPPSTFPEGTASSHGLSSALVSRQLMHRSWITIEDRDHPGDGRSNNIGDDDGPGVEAEGITQLKFLRI